VFSGPAGIGKSRLLDQMCTIAGHMDVRYCSTEYFLLIKELTDLIIFRNPLKKL